MDKYTYWLDNVLYLGDISKVRLLDYFQTGEGVYKATETQLTYVLDERRIKKIYDSKNTWDLDRKYEELSVKNIRAVSLIDEKYPVNLRNITDPPFCLYYKGALPDESLPGVAVIGARECSEYGSYIAAELGKCLGENSVQLISGMAAGIDGISQSAALGAGGSSYGVLGCGADICYPKSNRKLYQQLSQKGGIISSYPLGTQPLRQFFPPRNRIVSGLSDVIVVIEARYKSGTSITVEMALEQGKDIYAVPGRVTDRLSDGCNKMLKEGAHVFLSPQDFLQELHQLIPEKMQHADMLRKENICREDKNTFCHGTVKLNEDWEKILSVLDYYPQYVDAISERLVQRYNIKIAVPQLIAVLTQLNLLDLVKQESPGWFLKTGS